MSSRGMVAVMRAPSAVRSTCLMVSMAGVPTMAAPWCWMASMVRSMVASVDERTDGVVDEDDVAFVGGGKRGESVGDGVLAGVAARDDVHAIGQLVLGEQRGDARLVGLAYRDVNAGDARDGEEGAERVEQDGDAAELDELLGGASCCRGHTSTNARSGQNDEHRHGKRSIQLLEIRDYLPRSL